MPIGFTPKTLRYRRCAAKVGAQQSPRVLATGVCESCLFGQTTIFPEPPSTCAKLPGDVARLFRCLAWQEQGGQQSTNEQSSREIGRLLTLAGL
jgi:hypothetical protein